MWIQNYDPAGNIWLSALVAALPIICFLLCLVVFKLKGYQAGFITVVLAAAVAFFFYGMPVQLIGCILCTRLHQWYVANRLDYYRSYLLIQAVC